ncbi:MAG: PAS-domain containing protein [Sphingomonas sp.]|nr:PAS-domain containing protein [Sphingomonas sp.]
MIPQTPLAASLIGAALGGLILLASLCVYWGLRLRGAGRAAIERAARAEALLATSPAQAMIVASDGALQLPRRLADWLDLPRPPAFLAELRQGDAGLGADDLAALTADVTAAHKAARPFERSIGVAGGTRRLRLRGARGRGGVVLWVTDETEAADERARLQSEAAQAHAAFDALTALIEAAPMPMWYRGPDLKLMMVNSAYVRAVEGADAEDVVARGLELVDDAPLAAALEARDAGRPRSAELPATIRGARRMQRLYDVPLPGGGIAGFAIDIDDLEQAQGDLKRFAEAQRGMLDRLSAGVAQFSAERVLSFANQPFQRLFALPAEWLAQAPEFDRVLDRMRDAKRLPEVRDFPAWKAERRDWFTAPGQIEEAWHLPGGQHLRIVAQPMPDGGLLLIFEDRTEQVQLASARDTLLRVRTATFDNLFEAVGVFAADGRLQLWNNRFRLAWGFEEAYLASHPRVDALAQAAAAQLAKPGKAVLISEMVRSATLDRSQRGGRLAFADGRHFEFAAVPLPDGNALFTMIDETDSRKIEQALRDRNEALEAADRVKTAFVANMSYELRTPLTAISGFGQMLEGGLAGPLPEAADGYVRAILEAAERLGILIDDVLALTEEGRAPARAPVALAPLAEQVATKLRAALDARRIDFVADLHDAGEVIGDEAKLAQLIENLLRHALSGTPEGGRVLLRTDRAGEVARIIVSDNGRGMTKAAIARAFDRFAEPGITRGGERALGLGLPLARQIAEAHGGAIELLSERGQGTLITVTLPVSP